MKQAYIVQANPSAPGLAAGLIKSYCLHKLGLASEWNIDTINFEGAMYRRFKDTVSGHYGIDGVFLFRDLYRRLDRRPPDVIAFSSYSWNTGLFSYLSRGLRELFPNVLFVIGGLGIFGHEEDFLRGHPEFDIALSGEGEQALGALLTELITGAPDFARVPGLTMFQDSTVLKGPFPQLMQNLDDIPSPVTREYVSILNDPGNSANIMLETSRGCPMPCSFCLMSELPNKGRYHSFDYVREELDWVLAHGLNVEFADAIFHVNADRCNRILEYILSRHNGKSKFNFEIFVELLNDDTIKLMGEMAKRDILRPCQIGLQSIEPRALHAARRPFQRDRFDERLEKFYKATGNYAAIDLIFGLPDDSYDGYLRGIDYVFSKQPFAMLLHHLVIIRGTAQERDAVKHGVQFESNTGLVFKSRDWSREEMDRAAELSYSGRVIYNVRWWPLRILLFEIAGPGFARFLQDVVAAMEAGEGYSPDAERILDAAVSVLAARCDAVAEEPRGSHLRALLDVVEAVLKAMPPSASGADDACGDSDAVETWALNPSCAILRSDYTFAPALWRSEGHECGTLAQFLAKQEWFAVATRVRRDIAVIPGGFVEFLTISRIEWHWLHLAAARRLSWSELELGGTADGVEHKTYRDGIARLAAKGVIVPAQRTLGRTRRASAAPG